MGKRAYDVCEKGRPKAVQMLLLSDETNSANRLSVLKQACSIPLIYYIALRTIATERDEHCHSWSAGFRSSDRYSLSSNSVLETSFEGVEMVETQSDCGRSNSSFRLYFILQKV